MSEEESKFTVEEAKEAIKQSFLNEVSCSLISLSKHKEAGDYTSAKTDAIDLLRCFIGLEQLPDKELDFEEPCVYFNFKEASEYRVKCEAIKEKVDRYINELLLAAVCDED